MALVRDLTAQTGSATLLVTHDLQHVRADDRVVDLVDGRVVRDGVGLPAAA